MISKKVRFTDWQHKAIAIICYFINFKHELKGVGLLIQAKYSFVFLLLLSKY
jgi:isoprenylcysteine carboxyl methyltransferase (ICMT) family protein YpbQ